MIENFHRTKTYKDPTTFGGLILPSDFNTNYRGKNNTNGSDIASRIMSDKRFDNQCRRNRNL